MSRSTLALVIALVVSVSINLLIAGIIIGHRAAGGGPGGPPGGGGMGFLMDRTLTNVPESLRDDVRRRLREDKKTSRAQGEALHAARRRAVDTLKARPFDRDEAMQALAALRLEVDKSQQLLHRAVVDVLDKAQVEGTLPPPGLPPPRGHDRPGPDDPGAEGAPPPYPPPPDQPGD